MGYFLSFNVTRTAKGLYNNDNYTLNPALNKNAVHILDVESILMRKDEIMVKYVDLYYSTITNGISSQISNIFSIFPEHIFGKIRENVRILKKN